MSHCCWVIVSYTCAMTSTSQFPKVKKVFIPKRYTLHIKQKYILVIIHSPFKLTKEIPIT